MEQRLGDVTMEISKAAKAEPSWFEFRLHDVAKTKSKMRHLHILLWEL